MKNTASSEMRRYNKSINLTQVMAGVMCIRNLFFAIAVLAGGCGGRSEAPALSDRFQHRDLDQASMAGAVVEIGQRLGYSAATKDSEQVEFLNQDNPAFFVFLRQKKEVVATVTSVGSEGTVFVMIFESGEPDAEKRAKLMEALKNGLSNDAQKRT